MGIDLSIIWAVIIFFGVFMYIVMDGFDLGIGILFPFVPDRHERDVMMNTVAPVWDGNETWLVLGGGGVMAVFPVVYATVLPALYMPIMAMLLGLIFRGVAFEFRHRTVRGSHWWDTGFWIGSTVAAFSQGIALGALILHLKERRRGWKGWVFGGLCSLALAWSVWGGPYNGLWAGLLCIPVALAHVDRWRRWVPVAVVGVLGALPPLVAGLFLRRDGLPGTGSRTHWELPYAEPEAFRGGFKLGADLTDPFLPGFLTGGEAVASHTAYLGLVLVAAACVAAVRHPRARPFLAAAAAFALLSLGPWLYFGGSVLRLGDAPLAGPAGLAILAVPVLGRLTRWYRAGAVATLLLAPLAARLPRSTPVAIGLGLAILIDTLALAPLAWPLHASALPPTRPIAQLPHPGALLELPPVTSGEPPPGAWRDLSALAQVQHGRPIGGSMMGLGVSPAAREGTDAIRALTRTGQLDGVLHERIRSDGFRYLVIHLAHHPVPRAGGEHLTACLGPPVVHTATLRVHDLGVPGAPAGCSTDVMTVPSAGSGL